jgi:hypothetical protein
MKTLAAITALSALSFVGMIDRAHARIRSFEVVGRQFSYETTRPQQVAAARQLIAAANAADAAKAKAEAELAANPLAKLLGTQAQKEAVEAQAMLDQAIAASKLDNGLQQQQPGRQGQVVERSTATENQPSQSATAPVEKRAASNKGREADERATEAASSARASAASEPQGRGRHQPPVKSVFLDADSGIKTIFMADGSIHEEPIDEPKAAADPKGGGAGISTGSISRSR